MKRNIYDELKKIFHEPKRMAIMSALCASENGLTFTDLKKECELTDGNLSRHLKVLSETGAVKIQKEFVGVKPRTTVFLTEEGVNHFTEYLSALQEVLQQTLQKMPQKAKENAESFANLAQKA